LDEARVGQSLLSTFKGPSQGLRAGPCEPYEVIEAVTRGWLGLSSQWVFGYARQQGRLQKRRRLTSIVERRIADHCARFGMDPLTVVKHFPVLARRQALKRFLAHVDLFKMTLDVPGDIAELGVCSVGLGLFTWANLLGGLLHRRPHQGGLWVR